MNKEKFVEEQAQVFINSVLDDDIEVNDEMIIDGAQALLVEDGTTDTDEMDNIITMVVNRVYEMAVNDDRLTISNNRSYPITRKKPMIEEFD